MNGGISTFLSTSVGSKGIADGSTSRANKVDSSLKQPQQQNVPKISTKEENLAKLKSMTSDFWAQM